MDHQDFPHQLLQGVLQLRLDRVGGLDRPGLELAVACPGCPAEASVAYEPASLGDHVLVAPGVLGHSRSCSSAGLEFRAGIDPSRAAENLRVIREFARSSADLLLAATRRSRRQVRPAISPPGRP